jgi:Spy/CpxP family protein refolding chaperone
MAIFRNRHMLIWSILAVSVAFNLGFAGAYISRQQAPPPPDERPPQLEPREALEDMSLTDEQRVAWDAMSRQFLDDMNQLREDTMESRRRLMELVMGPAPDEATEEAINQEIETLAAMQAQGQRLIMKHLIDKRRVLRDDQMEAYRQLVRHQMVRFMKDRGPMRPRGEDHPRRGQEGRPDRGRFGRDAEKPPMPGD